MGVKKNDMLKIPTAITPAGDSDEIDIKNIININKKNLLGISEIEEDGVRLETTIYLRYDSKIKIIVDFGHYYLNYEIYERIENYLRKKVYDPIIKELNNAK